MKVCGIYKIQSKIKPERIYIGSSSDLRERKNRHLIRLRNGKHGNIKMQNHFNKYGLADFEFTVLLHCDKDELIEKEQYFIDAYNPFFNILPTAYSRKGYHPSAEAIEKYRIGSLGNTNRKGKPVSKETKERIRQKLIGTHPSEETKQKMREAAKRNGSKPPSPIGRTPWNKGLKNSENMRGHINKLKAA